MLGTRTTNNFLVCLLTRICRLRNATFIDWIALSFQNIKSFSQLFFRNSKFQIGATANIDHTLSFRVFSSCFINTLLDKFSSISSLHGTSFGVRIEKRTNSRFRKTELSTDFGITHSFFFFHSLSSLNLIDSSFIVTITFLKSELTSRRIALFVEHSHLSGDINFSHTLLLEFVITS